MKSHEISQINTSNVGINPFDNPYTSLDVYGFNTSVFGIYPLLFSFHVGQIRLIHCQLYSK